MKDKSARGEAARTLRRARKAAERGNTRKSAALVSIAEEFRLLADTEPRPVGFRKDGPR